VTSEFSARAPGTNPSDSTAATNNLPTPFGNTAAGSRAPESNGWRYRKHNGQWWYWLPSNHWVVWVGDKWVPYDSANDVWRYSTYRYAGIERKGALSAIKGQDNETT
jgi:hypothetical protein